MECRTKQSREKIQEVQDGTEQRVDTWSSGRSRVERRYNEFRTEQSRKKIQGVQDERE